MSATFRDAVPADLPALVALLADDMLGQQREVVSDPPLPAYVEALRAVLENPYDTMIVAEDGGRVMGCAQLTVLNGISPAGGAARAHRERARCLRSAQHRRRRGADP